MWAQIVAAILAVLTPSITIISTGDVMTARSINSRAVRTGDFDFAFRNLKPLFEQGDVVMINLESPLVTNCPSTNEGMVFCGDTQFAAALKKAGVTEVNIMNNHTNNYGLKGMETTRAALLEQSLQVVENKVSYREVKGQRMAFLGFDTVGKNPEVSPLISEARKTAKLVIVEFHWGEEYMATPTARQIQLAHTAIDAGADLVLGNHPHWVQPTEMYKNKLIVYSHGNTVFDQYWSEKTRQGVVGKYVFKGGTMIKVEFIETYTNEEGETELVSDGRVGVVKSFDLGRSERVGVNAQVVD